MKYIKSVKEFDEAVKYGTVLVDFYADWCGPCRMLGPVIEEISNSYSEDKLKVYKLNVDEVEAIAARYGVYSIPTVIIFKNGEVADTLVGFRPKANFDKAIAKII
ncbi:MAG: thioredoxin [Bacilli bacterium]|jgi:thioredoxin 1